MLAASMFAAALYVCWIALNLYTNTNMSRALMMSYDELELTCGSHSDNVYLSGSMKCPCVTINISSDGDDWRQESRKQTFS